MFKSPTVPTETPQQIHDAMARGEIVLIDVREPSEYAAERIHGAMLDQRSKSPVGSMLVRYSANHPPDRDR